MECDTAKMPQTLEMAGFAAPSKGENVTFYVTKRRILGWKGAKMQPSPQFLQNPPQNNKKDLHFCKTSGADTRIRTGDLILTKDALYLLSYISMLLHRATNIYYHIF